MVYDSVNNPACGGADTGACSYCCADSYACTCGFTDSYTNSAIHTGGNRLKYGFGFAYGYTDASMRRTDLRCW